MASERTCFQIKDSFSFSSNFHSLLFCLTSNVSMRLLGSQLIRIMRLKFVTFFRDRGSFFFSKQFQSCECNKSIYINQTCSRFYWENISLQSFFFHTDLAIFPLRPSRSVSKILSGLPCMLFR